MITIEKNKIYYIFDVDGTLTEPRQKMSKKFASFFDKWSDNKKIILSSGSDYEKIKEQIPANILQKCELIFSCMSNEIRDAAGEILASNTFEVSSKLRSDLLGFVTKSEFPLKTGNHLELRTGMLNFSTVGRNATLNERKQYEDWDIVNKERQFIANYVNKNYPKMEASVGGSISIDIINKGADKGQTINFLIQYGLERCVFVGDRAFPGGNDYGIIRELIKSNIEYRYYNVLGPKDTVKLITINRDFKQE
tara:strand:- start:2459 stop:3211 length:753 start_codon:yes stop_codon:yes gene_type:complete